MCPLLTKVIRQHCQETSFAAKTELVAYEEQEMITYLGITHCRPEFVGAYTRRNRRSVPHTVATGVA